MTVGDIIKKLIEDESLLISVQTNINGQVTELYNSDGLFDNIDNVQSRNIQYIKIENKKLFLIV